MDSTRDESIVQEALRLVELGRSKGVTLRMAGASAVRIHCQQSLASLTGLDRKLTDVDLIGYGKQKQAVMQLLTESGFQVPRHVTIGVFAGREIFANDAGMHGDIFFDKLDFCHTISFKDTLEIDYPTIPLAELVLEKTQIVKINEKDVKDAIVLLLEHEIDANDGDLINAERISKTLSNDWGFYYTVTTNLKKIMEACADYDFLSEDQRTLVVDRTRNLLEHIEKEPKTTGWRLRAKIGPAKKWYRDVEEVDRASWLRDRPSS